MYSLILFVDGFPVHFLVQQNDRNFWFQPVSNPYKKKVSKSIMAYKQMHRWSITGTDDENLIDQIVEDLSELQHA